MLLLLAPLLLGGLPWVLSLVLPRWLVVGSMVLVLGVPCLFVAALTLLFVHDWRAFTPFTPSAKPARSLGHRRYRGTQDLPEGDVVDAVIIGSGQGGLSCGATLAQYGERCVVCEQHEVTGGGAHSFAADGRNKWAFDAGLHITIPPHEQVLQVACGASSPPVRFSMLHDEHGASDYIALGGAPAGEAAVPVVAGPMEGKLNLEAELAARFPGHEEALRSYFELAERVQLRFGLLIATALFPSWVRVAFLQCSFMRLWRLWAAETGAAGLRKCFPGEDEASRRLRSYMIGLWLDTGAPPSRGSFFMQTAVLGGWQKLGEAYPVGGPQKTALAMVEAIEAKGGAVFVRCPVSKILLDETTGAACGVVLSNGDEIRARRVVSAAGYRATESLLKDSTLHSSRAAATATAYSPPARPLLTGQSAGFVMANIGLNGTREALGIGDATLWLQPADETNGYDALAGADAFFADPLGVPIEQIPAGITFPSVKGRNAWLGAKDGGDSVHHSCQILVPAEWRWFEDHLPTERCQAAIDEVGSRHAPPHLERHGQGEYDEIKAQWSARLLQLLHRHYPKTVGRVEFLDISTPLTIEHYLGSYKGAGVGLDVTPQRFVHPQELAELACKHPRVPGLWRAGQDYLMCGQVMAAASGIITALRMRGALDTLRFGVRALRLLVFALYWPADEDDSDEKKDV